MLWRRAHIRRGTRSYGLYTIWCAPKDPKPLRRTSNGLEFLTSATTRRSFAGNIATPALLLQHILKGIRSPGVRLLHKRRVAASEQAPVVIFLRHTLLATASMMRASSCHEAIFSPCSGHNRMISCWTCIFACGSQIRLAAHPESLAHPWENTSSAVTGTERGGALLFASPRCHVSLHDVLMPRRVVTDIRFSRKITSPPFCSASLRQGDGFAGELVSRTCCTGREG